MKGYSYIPYSSNITQVLPSDVLVSYRGRSLVGGVLFLCRDAVGIFFIGGARGVMVIAVENGHSDTSSKP